MFVDSPLLIHTSAIEDTGETPTAHECVWEMPVEWSVDEKNERDKKGLEIRQAHWRRIRPLGLLVQLNYSLVRFQVSH